MPRLKMFCALTTAFLAHFHRLRFKKRFPGCWRVGSSNLVVSTLGYLPVHFSNSIIWFFFGQVQVYSKQDPYNHPIVIDIIRNIWFSAKGKCDAWAAKDMLEKGMVAGETIVLIFTCMSFTFLVWHLSALTSYYSGWEQFEVFCDRQWAGNSV